MGFNSAFEGLNTGRKFVFLYV